MCVSLDRETAATYYFARQPRKCMIDYVIEEIAGARCRWHAETRWAALRLQNQAVAAQVRS